MKQYQRDKKKDISKTVAQYTKSGEWVATYQSLNDAERITEIPSGNISGCCNGKRKTASGYVWRFVDNMFREEQ